MIFNRSAPRSLVTPVLTVRDVREAVRFYCEAFGFVEHVQIGEGHRAQLGLPGMAAEIIVAEVRPGRRTPNEQRSHQIMLKVEDAAQTVARAQQLGAVMIDKITDWEYGERQVALDDPFGHQWILTQTVTDTAPEQWGGIARSPRG